MSSTVLHTLFTPSRLATLLTLSKKAKPELVPLLQKHGVLTHTFHETIPLLRETDTLIQTLARTEIENTQAQIRRVENGILDKLAEGGGKVEGDAIVEIRPGTGGEEAILFAKELNKMYTRYAERKGWNVAGDDKTITINQPKNSRRSAEENEDHEEPSVYEKLRFESGVHRVQRVPVTETQGRVHTSTVTVAVLPQTTQVPCEFSLRTLCD